MNICQLTTSIALLATAASSELSNEELRIFIAILEQFQYTINTVLVAREVQNDCQRQQPDQELQQEQQQEQQQQQEQLP